MMKRADRLFNWLTIVMLLLTVLTLAAYVAIALNPYLPINPFPPGTRVAIVLVPTATPTPEGVSLPPTWTPTATATVTPTPPPTFTPTVTPTPSPSPTLKPTETPTPRATRSPFPFTYEIQYETPYYGCNWAGVAGIIQDLDGNPLQGYPVHVWGGGLDLVVYSGDKTMYGAAGWEQFFNNYPIEISGEFKVQLHDKNAPHAPLSEQITLDFTGYCSKSMAYIVFTKNR